MPVVGGVAVLIGGIDLPLTASFILSMGVLLYRITERRNHK
jgi:hypothetical protein